MSKKILFAVCIGVMLSTLLPQFVAQLDYAYVGSSENRNISNIAANKYRNMTGPYLVNGSLTLDWAVWPEPYIVFWDCDGFVITGNNLVFDLNGHSVLYNTTTLGPGFTGIDVNGKSAVIIKNGTVIGFQWGIHIRNCSDVTMINNTVKDSDNYGIEVETNSRNITVINNVAQKSKNYGIDVETDSRNITVIGNTVLESSTGISAIKGVSDVHIVNNTVSKSDNIGIQVDGSTSIYIVNNNVSGNTREGILSKGSSHNVVSGNTISNNKYGISLYDSGNNTISNNTLSNNSPIGIEMETCSDNILYYNNFINNAKHVECTESNNVWDAGYGTVDDTGFGGNYWDRYDVADKFSGKNQNITGSDGIGDKPYNIDENDKDTYPLMNPIGAMLTVLPPITWELFDPKVGWTNVTCLVAAFSNSSVGDFSFKRSLGQISFKVTNGTFCKITVPKELLDGAFIVQVDGLTIPSISNWDKNQHFIDFALTNSNHTVDVKGQIVTPIVGDLNGDGIVNITDIAMAAANYGKHI